MSFSISRQRITIGEISLEVTAAVTATFEKASMEAGTRRFVEPQGKKERIKMRNAIRLFPLLFATVALVSAQTQLIGVSSVQSTLDNDTAGQAEAFQQTASTTGTVTAMIRRIVPQRYSSVYIRTATDIPRPCSAPE
jgi:hypothetical protein